MSKEQRVEAPDMKALAQALWDAFWLDSRSERWSVDDIEKVLRAASASGDAAMGAGLSSSCEVDSISAAAQPVNDVQAIPLNDVVARIERQIRLWNNDTVTMACADMLADIKQIPVVDRASPVQASVPAKGEAVTTDRLRAALEDIASQRLRSEIEPRNGEVSGDFEGAYDIMINSARDALAAASPAAPVFDDWVAWLRYDFTNEETTGTTIRVCDSDAKGAFKVYRATAPASVPVAQPPTADAEMVALEIVKSLYNVNCFECSDVFCAHWQSESASIIYDALTAAEQRGRDERQERDARCLFIMRGA